jgi:hypothetical protein
MVAVGVFVNMDVAVSLGMMIISLWFLLFQLLARPYKIEWVNTLQTAASARLLGIIILNSTAGVFFSVGFDPVGTPLEQIQQESEILMLLLLLSVGWRLKSDLCFQVQEFSTELRCNALIHICIISTEVRWSCAGVLLVEPVVFSLKICDMLSHASAGVRNIRR